ncbi:MAG: hypothetical protein ACPL3C_04530 [Pyrobaculum sp.]
MDDLENEIKIIQQIDDFLKTVRCEGLRVLAMIYFANKHIKWIDAVDALPYGFVNPTFYTFAVKLEKYGLVQRRRLDIKTYLRITEKGKKLVETLIEMSQQPKNTENENKINKEQINNITGELDKKEHQQQ